jgi:hypothetical protein
MNPELSKALTLLEVAKPVVLLRKSKSQPFWWRIKQPILPGGIYREGK